jgi:peptidoglycan/LPS O-acetylase OafA/YrhL
MKYTRAFIEQSDLLHPKYRPDIDGLRAIAVLAVLGFHAFPVWITSGFIGVDIFFVISGFLITGIIVGSFENEGFSYRIFYARRIRRIFPALALVMAVTLAAGWYLLVPDEWAQLGRHLAGSAGFVSNFVFWHEAGYFDTDSNTKLLLHLWSLAIEEQFYIVWPLLLGLVWWRRWSVLPVLVALALLSFLSNVWLVSTDHPTAAFYAPWARAWELAAGGILACLRLHTTKPWLPWSPVLRSHVQSTVGILLLAIGLAFIQSDRTFPGWWALLPVLGAMLCIAAGPMGWFNRVLLAWRPLVRIGLISYPLYLWHWPLLAFVRVLAAATEASRSIRAGALMLALVLAWLTYVLVEKRLRHSRNRSVIIVLCSVMGLLGVTGLLAGKNYWASRLSIPLLNSYFHNIEKATHDWDFPGAMEQYSLNGGIAYRMGHGTRQVLLLGDSHVEQIAPRLQALLDRDSQLPVTLSFLISSGCPPIMNTVKVVMGNPCSNTEHNRDLELARSDAFDTIVLGGRWNGYLLKPEHWHSNMASRYVNGTLNFPLSSPEGINAALHTLEQELAELVALHKTVYLLLDNPEGLAFAPDSIIEGKRWGSAQAIHLASLSVPYPPDQARLHARMRELALRVGAQVIDPIQELCDEGQCIRTTVDGIPVYKDYNHLSSNYMRQFLHYPDVLVALPH